MTRQLVLSVLFSIALLSGSRCWGQTGTPTFQVFGGYAGVPTSFATFGGAEKTGWNAALDLNSKAYNWIGFTADFGQYYSTFSYGGGTYDSFRTSTFLFGPRFFYAFHRASNVTAFAHSLFGAAKFYDRFHDQYATVSRTSTSFAWVPIGGGLDYRIARHFSLRVQADLLHTSFQAVDTQDQPLVPNWHARLSAGIVAAF